MLNFKNHWTNWKLPAICFLQPGSQGLQLIGWGPLVDRHPLVFCQTCKTPEFGIWAAQFLASPRLGGCSTHKSVTFLRSARSLWVIWPSIRGRQWRERLALSCSPGVSLSQHLPPALRFQLGSGRIKTQGEISGRSFQFPSWKASQAVWISKQESSICSITHECLQWACWNVTEWIIAMTYFGWTPTKDFLNPISF